MTKRVNVVLARKRTSITINPTVLELIDLLDGTPTLQDLIDDELSYGVGYPENGVTMSSWVTSVICQNVLDQYQEEQ